jgi:glycosyltransferase involved in cell wall biosynthesis
MQPTVDICMTVDNDVRADGRVRKEAASLTAQGWRVLVIGIATGDPSPPDEEVLPEGFTVRLVKPRLLRGRLRGKYGKAIRRLVGYWLAARAMRRVTARVYHGHDFSGLLVVFLAGLTRRRFVYDSHELYFDRNAKGSRTPTKLFFRLLRPLEKPLARRAAAVITVSDAIADRLAQTLDIPRPLVLRNAVDLRNAGAPVTFSASGRKAAAHTGGIISGRHLPELVESLAYLPDEVALVLIGGGPLKAALLERAARLGVAERLMIVPPVPVNSVSPTLAQADCAALMFAPDALNYQFALPNKFFEAVAAGLPLVYGTTQEVNRLAQEYGFGVSCDPTDPHSIADAILKVLEPEANARCRENARKAREVLNWETEEQKLLALYRQILED